MSTELKDLGAFVLETAKKAGAGDCQVTLVNHRFVSVAYRNRKPESAKEATTQSIDMSLFVDGRYGVQSTKDVRRDALKSFILNGVESIRFLGEDPNRSLPDPRYYAGRAETDLRIFDPVREQLTSEQRHAAAKSLEAACLEVGGDDIISISAQVNDSVTEEAVLNSNGFSGEMKSTAFDSCAVMTARDEGDRRPTGYYYASSCAKDDLPSGREIASAAAAHTQSLMRGRKLPTETLPIIIENRVAEKVLNGVVSAMNGWALQQKRSFLIGKRGEKIGSDVFTLVDDPHLPSGFGSRLYDSDGIATRKRTMVDKGILKEYYIDWYRSRKLGVDPTTGSTSNLVLPPGKRPVRSIMKDLGRGIFVNGFIGGNSNSNTGDFSMGITGTLFENGEPVHAVSEMNIAGNHLEFWRKLAEAADDPWRYSACRVPSLVFMDVVVAGT